MSIRWKQIFCDETENFCLSVQPEMGDSLALRLRVARGDLVQVRLVTKEGGKPIPFVRTEGAFDFYEIEILPEEEQFSYYFEIHGEGKTYFYNRRGLIQENPWEGAFCRNPRFIVPQWARGAVMYQIFIDRFCREGEETWVRDGEYPYVNGLMSQQVRDWNENPQPLDVHRFYGGNLPGVRKKLDYLQYLGIEAIYFNPVFVSPSNHKYDIQDYEHVDPHLAKIPRDGDYRRRTTDPENLKASDDFFAQFIEEAHQRGIRVIVDGVFNHCSSFHPWMDRGGYYGGEKADPAGAWWEEKSPYRQFFRFSSEGEYESWWNHSTLPKLNYEDSPELWKKIYEIGARWVSPPFCADGWRLDVAADLGHSPEVNHQFWKGFRQAVREANPQAILLAEHYGDVSTWLQGDEWDSVMNYDAFMEPVSFYLTGMEKHSDAFCAEKKGDGALFFAQMKQMMSRFPLSSLQVAMNQLDNHDHSRFLTRTNGKVGRLGPCTAEEAEEGVSYGLYRAAVVMQMTWPGAPTLYYGNETGICGWTDPDNRRTYPWGRENWELVEFYREIIFLHKKSPALCRGSLIPLLAGESGIAYGRFLGEELWVIAIQPKEEQQELWISLAALGIEDGHFQRRMETTEEGYNIGEKNIEAVQGCLRLCMPPQSAMVLEFLQERKEDRRDAHTD